MLYLRQVWFRLMVFYVTMLRRKRKVIATKLDTRRFRTKQNKKVSHSLDWTFWLSITLEVCDICEKPRHADEPWNQSKQLSMSGYSQMALTSSATNVCWPGLYENVASENFACPISSQLPSVFVATWWHRKLLTWIIFVYSITLYEYLWVVYSIYRYNP